MIQHEVSEALVDLLNANEVEFVFYNPGLEDVPILQALSTYRASGKPTPRAILCLDESVALAAAHGNYLVSGRPQIVLVHSEIGTLQIGGALHQAQWGRVPVVICAGLLGRKSERLTWKNSPYDQGSIVRNSVKREYELGDNGNFCDALQQALDTAISEPRGPVYLYFPIETLFNKPSKTNSTLRQNITSNPALDSESIDKAVGLLLKAENPIVIAGYSGRNPESIGPLIKLAETLGARVVTGPVAMSFPADHALCASVEPNDGISIINPYLPKADVVLVIDYDLPYVPPRHVPNPNARIIHIDVDFAKRGIPLWGRQADICIKADSSKAIPALLESILNNLTFEQRTRFENRFRLLEKEHQHLREEWRNLAISQSEQMPISAEWFCYCLNKVIDKDTIIVNQTISPSISVARQICRTKPGTLLACSGGSIGWALPAALGVKLAAPDRTVVSLMGDGAFVYGCPTATLWSASYFTAPFLSIIFNNQAYGAIKMAYRGKPQTDADIVPSPDYALVAQACHAYGRTVADPHEVLPALEEALQQVHQGKPAVLDVRLKRA